MIIDSAMNEYLQSALASVSAAQKQNTFIFHTISFQSFQVSCPAKALYGHGHPCPVSMDKNSWTRKDIESDVEINFSIWSHILDQCGI